MQSPLFLESFGDALKAIVDHAGGPKSVGPLLWPAPIKKPEDARVALLNCLNPDRGEKFSLEQIVKLLQIGREVGYHQAKHWLDDACGYAPSMPADPIEQEAEQVRAVREAGETLRRALETLDRLQAKKAEPAAIRTIAGGLRL